MVRLIPYTVRAVYLLGVLLSLWAQSEPSVSVAWKELAGIAISAVAMLFGLLYADFRIWRRSTDIHNEKLAESMAELKSEIRTIKAMCRARLCLLTGEKVPPEPEE